MISIETKQGPITIEESLRTPALRDHMVARKVESKEDWKAAKSFAAAMIQWFEEVNGTFKGAWSEGYALHCAQLWPSEEVAPFNFFVVDKKLTTKEWAKKHARNDRSIRDITNIVFPAQVIYNPEIVTATQTFLDDAIEKRTGKRYKRGTPNVMRYDEGCMSYNEQTRSAKRIARFYRIKVRYQIVKPALFGLSEKVETIEEWCQGLKAHIFQHECDHSAGIDIIHGDKDGKMPTIEERELENGYTRKEIEEFTEKKIRVIEEAVQQRGMCILQSVTNGRYYRCPTTLDALPDGFLEPDVIELYDMEGRIKPPFDQVPMYTDPSAHQETPDHDAISFDGQKVEKTKSGFRHRPFLTKAKVQSVIGPVEPSKLDGCYYLEDVVFYELADRLASNNPGGNPNAKENILGAYEDIAERGFTVHGMVFYPVSKRKIV